jgi:SAM-dependent methyltransferase
MADRDLEPTTDLWSGADTYERYIGRWGRPVAVRFVQWLAWPRGERWIEVGCGTGALTETILAGAEPSRVLALDPSESFVEAARGRIQDERVQFAIASADALPASSGAFDIAVSGLVMNFVPDIGRALAEQCRVVRPGGCVAGYVWDYGGGMQLIRVFWDAAVALDPGVRERDQAERFPVARADALKIAWQTAGLRDIEVEGIEVPTRFVDFDDYWSPFLGGVGPAPGYAVSLSPLARDRLRERLSETLPIAADGSISLKARAWAVKGSVP